MFNLPPNIFQNLPWLQNLQGGAGNSKWSTINPFRTVDNGFQYGSGNNASAGQLYNHFHRKAALDKQAGNENASIADYGLTPGHKVQSISDFLERRNPKPIETPVPPPKDPGNIPGNIPGLPPGFQMPDFSKLGIFNIPNFAQQQPSPLPMPGADGMPPNLSPGQLPQFGQPQQPMPNPQVPQFNPSLFNMQPQMNASVPRPQPGGTPRRGVM